MSISNAVGVHRNTLWKAARGEPVSANTTRKIVKLAGQVRTADEFGTKRAALAQAPRPPKSSNGVYAWDLEKIRNARDAQLNGRFALPVQLATAMRTESALFVAYNNRVAPQKAVSSRYVEAAGVRGEAVRRRASQSVHLSRSTLTGIAGTLANHGIAIGYNDRTANDAGTRIDFSHREWPLEHVYWDEYRDTLMTRVEGGPDQAIVHGDGEWVVYRNFKNKPWRQAAAILPASMVWPASANGVGDWAGASKAHGNSRVVGMLPEGAAINEDGELTEVASAFLQTLTDLVSGEAGAGIIPHGASADFLSNGSTAWQVFDSLLQNREKAAARIYLGTDAILGSVGGAPGVDISALFGVATTIIQGDFDAIQNGVNTGILQPWTAINEGDSKLAPRFLYEMPDPDARAKSEERAAARDRLGATLKEMRSQKFVVTQDVVNTLSAEYGVSPAPLLAAVSEQTAALVLAPTSLDLFVRGREARASQGLPPFGDARDDMTLAEIKDRSKAKADIAVNDAGAPAPAPEGAIE